MSQKYIVKCIVVSKNSDDSYKQCLVLQDKEGHERKINTVGYNTPRGRIKAGTFVTLDEEARRFKIAKINKKTNYTRQILDNYCVLDLETTGFDAYADEIIEIAMLRVCNNEIVKQYSQLIKPRNKIPQYITALTGITDEMVADMPSIKDVREEVLSFIGDDVILGHFSSFDVRFLKAGLSINLRNQYVDTLQFARKIYPSFTSHRLEDLSRRLNLSKSKHRALADCIATKELYDKIKHKMEVNNWTVDSLWGNHVSQDNRVQKGCFQYLGKEQVQRDGRVAKVVEYRKYDDIDVEYEDGTVINTSITKWKNGRVLNFKRSIKTQKTHPVYQRTSLDNSIGKRCSFGDNCLCDDTCKYYRTCSRVER